jgi:hypothetical protein
MNNDLISHVFPYRNINKTSNDDASLFKSNNKYLSENGDILDYKCPFNLKFDSTNRAQCYTQNYHHKESTFKICKTHPGKLPIDLI